MMFRVIRVHDWPTYEGWMWLDGYQLNAAGDAVERRSIFVQRSGLHMVAAGQDKRGRSAVAQRGAASGRSAGRAAASRPAIATAH
jgi:hypothetical protein